MLEQFGLYKQVIVIRVLICGDLKSFLDNKLFYAKCGCDMGLKTPNILMKTSSEFGKYDTFCPAFTTQLLCADLCGKWRKCRKRKCPWNGQVVVLDNGNLLICLVSMCMCVSICIHVCASIKAESWSSGRRCKCKKVVWIKNTKKNLISADLTSKHGS